MVANPNDNPAGAMSLVPEKSFHVRSASLPCRSHHIISEVEDGIANLRSWQSGAECGSLCTGLALIEQLHTFLDDLLRLPKSQESLRRRSPWTDRLIEDFLLLADAHGTFRSTVMTLKHNQSVVQTAIRRRDEATLISSAKSQRCTEKELVKLASTLQKVSKPLCSATILCTSDAGVSELAGILREATLATVSASAFIFLAISAMASSTTSNDSWMVGQLKRLSSSPKKKGFGEEEQRMNALRCSEGLEECLGALENKSERVFKTLMNTRVALLNILTL